MIKNNEKYNKANANFNKDEFIKYSDGQILRKNLIKINIITIKISGQNIFSLKNN